MDLQITNAIQAIKTLRGNVGQVFESLGNGISGDQGDEIKETNYLQEIVNANLR